MSVCRWVFWIVRLVIRPFTQRRTDRHPRIFGSLFFPFFPFSLSFRVTHHGSHRSLLSLTTIDMSLLIQRQCLLVGRSVANSLLHTHTTSSTVVHVSRSSRSGPATVPWRRCLSQKTPASTPTSTSTSASTSSSTTTTSTTTTTNATTTGQTNPTQQSWVQWFLGPKEMPPRGTATWYREITLICTVFAITGTSTMFLVSCFVAFVWIYALPVLLLQ